MKPEIRIKELESENSNLKKTIIDLKFIIETYRGMLEITKKPVKTLRIVFKK